LMFLGRTEEAEAGLSALWETTTGELEVFHLANLQTANLYWRLGRLDEAEAVLDRAASRIVSEELLDQLSLARTMFWLHDGRVPDALALIDEVGCHKGTSPATAALAGRNRAAMLACLGDVSEAIEVSRAADELAPDEA